MVAVRVQDESAAAEMESSIELEVEGRAGDQHRNQHHLDNIQQHAQRIHSDRGCQIECAEQRRHKHAEQGGDQSHADGERHVATGQKADDIGSGTAGAAADQHHSCSQLGRKLQNPCQHERYQGHDQKLQRDADENRARHE